MNVALELLCFASGTAFIWLFTKMVMHPAKCGSGTMTLVALMGSLCVIAGSYLVQRMGASWISLAIGIALSSMVVKMFALRGDRD